MNSLYFQAFLAICTILGGIAAIFYFNEKLCLLTWTRLREMLSRPPKTPITASSIGAYVKTNERVRALDEAIAQDFGDEVERRESDWEWLKELAQAVGVQTIRDLDRLVNKHARHARLLARSFQTHKTIFTAHGVQLVLEIEVMNNRGLEGFIALLRDLKLTSTDAGFAKDLWDGYQRIIEHGS